MSFDTIRNAFESAVVDAVRQQAPRFPCIQDDVLADVACVALNRLPPRYIRHSADLAFYQGDAERLRNDEAVRAAVQYAFEFIQSRQAMRVRA